MNRQRFFRIVRRVWIGVGLGATAIFVVWSLIAYRASDEARSAIVSDSSVLVQRSGGIWSFIPGRRPDRVVPGLIFFPGALVSPVAYAPLARAIAAAGFPAYIIELPRRAAFGGADAPALDERFDRLRADSTTPRRWVIAGHSRGAVVASRFAAASRQGMSGLVLIGTTHPRDVDLSKLATPVTKVVATRDRIADSVDVEANRSLLPASTHWTWIQGGNHSQFGWYGFQPFDGRATIPAAAQRAVMIRAVLRSLEQAAANTAGALRGSTEATNH